MAAFLEPGAWVWTPDEEDIFLPGKIITKEGDDFKVEISDGEIVVMPAKDLRPCDPKCLEPIDDLCNVNDLNEMTLLHNLRQRFKQQKIYTSVGQILVAVNPFKLLPIYTPEWLDRYKLNGSRNQPPHVYGVADNAYRNLINFARHQSVIISGESGAGKTETMKLVLQYIAEVSGKNSSNDAESGPSLEEQILKANPVMEAFGNAKTTRNNNSSRFGKWTEIQFDAKQTIVGGKIINYLLEKSRVVFQADQERNYHAFYQLLEGGKKDENLQKDLDLYDIDDFYYLNQSKVKSVPGINDERDWDELLGAMDILGMTKEEKRGVLEATASVLHIGNLKYAVDETSASEDGCKISNKDQLGVVAKHISVDPAALGQALTKRGIGAASVVYVAYTVEHAEAARDALAKALYGNMFNWLIRRINKSLEKGLGGGSSAVKNIIGVLDIFGFESFEVNSFEQLCINYCNEKLQNHFNDHIFKHEQEQYKAEGVDVAHIDFEDNQACLDLIEAKKVGIFAMMDEEIVTPKGSDEGFLSKLKKRYGERGKEHKHY